MGRKDVYDKEICPRIVERLAALGFTSEDMISVFGISATTWCKWKKDHPEFNTAIVEGKGNADKKVVSALYKRALGYDVIEKVMVPEHQEKTNAKRGRGRPKKIKMVLDKITKKHIPGEVVAMKYWLGNRDRVHWSDRQNIDLNGQMEFTIIPAKNPNEGAKT
jgi:hypothetical protein